jgi:hypothetical protein
MVGEILMPLSGLSISYSLSPAVCKSMQFSKKEKNIEPEIQRLSFILLL